MSLRVHPLSRLYDLAIYTVLTLLLVSFIYPLYHIFVVSVSGGSFVLRGEVGLLPKGFTLDAYRKVIELPSFLRTYGNTLVYTVCGTALNLLMTSLCAYPLSRGKLFGRKTLTVMIIFTLLFHGGMIPTYLVVNNLGLLDSIWAIILPPAINVWYLIIMRTFFQNIPSEIHESAFMDGANDLFIFLRIVLPLSMPVMATMTMFYAVWHWNSFFPALLYLNNSDLYPVQLLMRSFVIEGGLMDQTEVMSNMTVVQTSIKYAVIIITILPIVCVYPFVQRYFVKGMMVGALKG